MAEPTKPTPPPPSAKRSSRSPAFVYSATTMVVVLVIGLLTITASQTPPPAIAELAPSAVQQIKDPPPEQASDVGSGEGGAGFGEAVTTTTTVQQSGPPPTIVAPRQRSCVNDTQFGTPPRQTEDPQSPPCVPLWTGKDNGGATYKGVTADEIRIAVPSDGGELTRGQKDVEAFYNKRYEFYGRRIKLIPVKVASNFSDTTKITAAADQVESLNVFASLNFTIQSGNETLYYDALAKKGIISVSSSFAGTPSTTEAHMRDKAPYQWAFFPSIDTIFKNYAEFVCKALRGRPQWAGGAELAAPTRKFGILVDTNVKASEAINFRLLTDATKAQCGIQWVFREAPLPPQEAYGGEEGRKHVVFFKEQQVTTFMCMCGYAFLRNSIMGNANGQNWFPEYLIHNFGSQDTDYGGQAWQGETTQRDHVIGLRSWNKALPRDQAFHWRAKREMDPTIPPEQWNFDTNYLNLLLLASGIQGAGPTLTPQTFAAALRNTAFPNPGCGTAPLFQACVGFKDGGFTMINDFVPVWWNANGNSNEVDASLDAKPERRGGYGAFCYPDQGKRYSEGRWPTSVPFFTNPCN